jgi:hypothetical protein
MWESRGLCEISKGVWTSVCDVHATVISTAGGRAALITGAACASSTAQDARGATMARGWGSDIPPMTTHDGPIMIGGAPCRSSRGAV